VRGERQVKQQQLRETLRRDPRHRDAHLNLGIGYLQEGQTERAVTQLRILTASAPHDAEAHYILAVAYAQEGQPEAMVAALQQVVRLDPEHARAHSTLAAFYLQQQQYELAWQHASTAARLGAPVQSLLEALQQVQGSPAR
jgi:Tfp pilus assembly protein PilF